MAVYGISLYGSATYGDPGFTQLSSNLAASPRGYDRVSLTWDIPNGSWSQMALVRSSLGFPSWVGEGTLLFTDLVGNPRTSFVDGDPYPLSPGPLRSGQFYYYTLFVLLDPEAIWQSAGNVIALTTQNHGMGAAMWDLLPEFYREDDAYLGYNPLQNFLSLFGYQQDRLRTEIVTLLDVYNIDKVSGGLLPHLAQMLGRAYEPEMGMIRSRVITKNSIYMAKMKGTRLGIEAAASSYSGYGASASVGINLLLDRNDSEFTESTGHWTNTQNCTLTRVVEASFTPNLPGHDNMRLRGGNGGTTAIASSGVAASLTAIPVEPSTVYTASAWIKAASTTRSCSVGVSWYTVAGTFISTTDGTASADSAAAWTRFTHTTAASPANAAFAVVRVLVAAIANAEDHYINDVQLEAAGAATTYQSARLIKINLNPYRINEIKNPSFETNTTNWAAGASSAIVQSATEAKYGTNSLRLTRTGTTGTAIAVETMSAVDAVAPNDICTFSVWLKSGTARSFSLQVLWYNAAGTQVGATITLSTATSTTGWVRYSGTTVVPATAVRYATQFSVAAVVVGEFHYFDGVLMEKSPALRDYFDASTTVAGEGLWESTTHGSRSFFYPQRAWRNYRLIAVLPSFSPPGQDISLIYAPAA